MVDAHEGRDAAVAPAAVAAAELLEARGLQRPDGLAQVAVPGANNVPTPTHFNLQSWVRPSFQYTCQYTCTYCAVTTE